MVMLMAATATLCLPEVEVKVIGRIELALKLFAWIMTLFGSILIIIAIGLDLRA